MAKWLTIFFIVKMHRWLNFQAHENRWKNVLHTAYRARASDNNVFALFADCQPWRTLGWPGGQFYILLHSYHLPFLTIHNCPWHFNGKSTGSKRFIYLHDSWSIIEIPLKLTSLLEVFWKSKLNQICFKNKSLSFRWFKLCGWLKCFDSKL